jgi:xylose isomerase
MDIAIIIEIVAGIVTICGTIIANIIQTNKRDEIQDERFAGFKNEVTLKIDSLKKEVEKHNQLVERTHNLETKTATLNLRLENIEGNGKK